VVVPDDHIKKFGADTIRIYLMFLGPFERGGDFRDSGIAGITRFLERVYKLKSSVPAKSSPKAKNLEKILHQSIKKITEDIENSRYNTAISQLMILLNEMERVSQLRPEDYKVFLKLLAPFAPHLTEELWSKTGSRVSIHLQKWPLYDQRKIKEETFELVIQINGKVRAKTETPINIRKQQAEKLALGLEPVKKFTKGKAIKKIIFVPGRLINIVL
jgi:leucyl-tRNA synthetase